MAERLPTASDAALHPYLTIKSLDALSSTLAGGTWSDQMFKVLKPESCRVETLAEGTRTPATPDPSLSNLVRLDVGLPQIGAMIVLTLLGNTTAGDTLSVVMMIGLDPMIVSPEPARQRQLTSSPNPAMDFSCCTAFPISCVPVKPWRRSVLKSGGLIGRNESQNVLERGSKT